MISWAPISGFAVAFGTLLWCLTPIRQKYLDPHILRWSNQLLQQPGLLPKQIGWLLRRLTAPAIHVSVMLVGLWIFVSFVYPPPTSPQQIAKHLTITQKFILCTSYLDQDKRGIACPQTLKNAGLIMQTSGSDWYLLMANALQDLARQGLVEERPPTLRRDGVSSFETPLTPLGREVVKYLKRTEDL